MSEKTNGSAEAAEAESLDEAEAEAEAEVEAEPEADEPDANAPAQGGGGPLEDDAHEPEHHKVKPKKRRGNTAAAQREKDSRKRSIDLYRDLAKPMERPGAPEHQVTYPDEEEGFQPPPEEVAGSLMPEDAFDDEFDDEFEDDGPPGFPHDDDDAKLTGVVKVYSNATGSGLITPDNGDADIVVHQADIKVEGPFQATLAEGDAVKFYTQEGDNGSIRAIDVTVYYPA